MKHRNILLLLITSIIFGCETANISPNKLFVKEIIDPNCYRDVYEYQNDLLIGFKRYRGDHIGTSAKFQYLKNQLVKIEINRDNGLEVITELTYGDNGLRREGTVTYIENEIITSIDTRTYSYKDNVLESILYSSNDPNSLPAHWFFEWSNGNLIKMNSYFNDGQLFVSRTMIYDNNMNYSNQDIAFVYVTLNNRETFLSKNNLINTVDEMTYGGIVDRGSFIFTYNRDGYPIEYVYKLDSQEFNPVQIKYE